MFLAFLTTAFADCHQIAGGETNTDPVTIRGTAPIIVSVSLTEEGQLVVDCGEVAATFRTAPRTITIEYNTDPTQSLDPETYQ